MVDLPAVGHLTWGTKLNEAVLELEEGVENVNQRVADAEGLVMEVSGLTGEDAAVSFLMDDTESATRASTETVAGDLLVAEASDEESAFIGALTGNGRRPVGRGELVLHCREYGAVGDGVTDDTAALQAAIDAIKAFPTTDPPLSRPVILSGQGGIYKITSSLDLTGITLGRGWAIQNLGLIAACTDDVALDFTASRFGRLSNVRVWGDQSSQPHTGIALSRTATATCTHFLMDNVTVDGYFTSSALHVNAAEENHFLSSMFVNRRVADGSGEAWAVILDGAGYKALPSAYETPVAARSSFTVNKFDKCTIQKPFGIAGPTMFMQDASSVSFESCYITAGSDSAIEWRLTDGFTPYRVYMDFQIETTGIDRFMKFTTDGVTGVHEIRGLHCTFGNMFTDSEVYSLDAGIVSLALRSFKSHIYRWAAGVSLANDLFGTPSKVSIYGGDIVVPTAGDLNTPAGFARLDATVLTMDGTTVNWTYVPTLTNWTLGNGTIVGEYKRGPGRMIDYVIRYTVGSTDTPSGNLAFSLPFPADGGATGRSRGTAHLFDASTSARRNRFVTHATTTTVQLADADNTLVAAATPWTWAAGDTIDIVGSYEPAD